MDLEQKLAFRNAKGFPYSKEILTTEALRFVAELVASQSSYHSWLLDERRERQKRNDADSMNKFIGFIAIIHRRDSSKKKILKKWEAQASHLKNMTIYSPLINWKCSIEKVPLSSIIPFTSRRLCLAFSNLTS